MGKKSPPGTKRSRPMKKARMKKGVIYGRRGGSELKGMGKEGVDGRRGALEK